MSEQILINDLIPCMCLACIGGISRLFVSTERHLFSEYLKIIVVSMFFGYMVNAYVSDAMLPFGQKTVIVGISGFVAHDILRGVKKISRAIGNDPDVFLKIIMNRKIEFPDKDKPEKPK